MKGERILFFGRNRSYKLTKLCFLDLYRFIKDSPHEIVGVVFDRELESDLHASPKALELTLEELVSQLGIFAIQAPMNNDVNESSFLNFIRALRPSLILTVQFPCLFQSELIQLPEKVTLNLHRGWPLRGGSIDERAIYFQLKSYFLILHHIHLGIDSGPILGKKEIFISPEETGYSLVKRVDQLAPNVLRDFLYPYFGQQFIQGEVQNKKDTFFGNKGSLSDLIDFGSSAEDIQRKTRAFFHPRKKGARMRIRGENLWVPSVASLASDEASSSESPGTIISMDVQQTWLATAKGKIGFREIERENGARVPFGSFLQEQGLKSGDLIHPSGEPSRDIDFSR